MIKGLTNGGAISVLERVVQFTGARHGVLTHNIANLDTPYFKPVDLDPNEFQSHLAEAIEERRRGNRPMSGSLDLDDTAGLRFHEDRVEVRPEFRNDNILFHDRNNRDLERLMQDLVENTLAHSTAIDLLKSEFDILRTAIRERV